MTLPQTEPASLNVKETARGKGVFAGRNFKKGEEVIQFRGEFFTFDTIPLDKEIESHSVQIGKDLYLGPSGGTDDLFNHSCDPNAGLQINSKEVWLVTHKYIGEGEEITWDYSTTMDEDSWEMECDCGSPLCRKKIRDFKYLPKELQQKYIELKAVPDYLYNQSAAYI